MTVVPGQIIDDKYRVIRQLGEGGMGAVFEVDHTLLDRRFALKVMNADRAEDQRSVERFFREAKAASAIGHPNIIEIYDIGKEADGTLYFVMEFLQGESLEALLNRQERLSPERAAAIILQTLSALHFAHEKGIIHRDLKPANIFLAVDVQGREMVKLLDFGVAKVADPSGEAKKLTLPGAMMGTPRYASPEQIKGKGEIDHRSDLWAAGVVLYELIAGNRPFEGESFSVVLSSILMETPTPLRETLPDVSAELSRIADKAMAKNPDDRYQSAQEMIRDLTPFQNAALSVMSGTAAEVLSTSFPPAAPYVLSGMETDPSGVTPAGDDGPRTGASDRFPMGRVALIASILVFAVGAVLFFIRLFSGAESAGKIDENTASQAALVDPASISSPQVTSEENTANTPKDEPEEASGNISEVTLSLTGLPDGAEVTLDGKSYSVPIRVERSDKPAILKITARRYRPLIQAVSLSEDQEIPIEMKKVAFRKKTRKKRFSKKKR